MNTGLRVRRWGVSAVAVAALLVGTSIAGEAGAGAPEPSPVRAQNAVRPQLPGVIPFALSPVQRGKPVDPAAVRSQIGGPWNSTWLGSPALRGLTIRDAITGEHLVDLRADQPFTPASITKVLSAAAIVAALPPETTFTTTVLSGPNPGDVVLVAGGDQLLGAQGGNGNAVAGRVGLASLAAATATSLRESGYQGPVRVLVDTSYARGSDVAPGWTDFWLRNGYTGRIAMLALEQDRAVPGSPAPADLTTSVAQTFQQRLQDQGLALATTDIELIGGGASAEPEGASDAASATATTPAEQAVLASAESAPLREVLALALTTSDNAMIEQLSRQGAVAAGAGATQPEVNRWVLQTLEQAYDIDVTGAVLADTSGLSQGTQLSMRIVADVLEAGASGANPELQSVLGGLPIAGYNGTLSDRFTVPGARNGRGVVRAKTGSLPSVTSLAGTVTTGNGRLLAFALTTNDLGDGSAALEGRAVIDELVTALANCGC